MWTKYPAAGTGGSWSYSYPVLSLSTAAAGNFCAIIDAVAETLWPMISRVWTTP